MAALPAATLLPPHAARGATGPASAVTTEARAAKVASAKNAGLRAVTARSAALTTTAPASAATTEAHAAKAASAKSAVLKAVTARSAAFDNDRPSFRSDDRGPRREGGERQERRFEGGDRPQRRFEQ